MKTEIIIDHKAGGEQLSISPGVLAKEEENIGRAGQYKDYGFLPDEKSFLNFRDCSISFADRLRGRRQNIIQDIDEAINDRQWEWRGPSWDRFFYAVCNGRPISIITARGHSVQTMHRALNHLCRRACLRPRPNILSIYPVTNPQLKQELAASAGKDGAAELKRVALFKSVELAFKKYGQNPFHRFGISDDSPRNVVAITRALAEIKGRYPDNRFFIIDTSGEHLKKLEVFPDHVETSHSANLPSAINYKLFE